MSGGPAMRGRVSSEQLDALLSFMEEHPDFAAGKQSVYSRFSSSKLWRLLAERLNAAAGLSGGSYKSPDKWCRYWADIKYKARKKSAAAGALGDLSHHEERLRDLLKAAPDPLVGGGGGGTGRARRRSSPSDSERGGGGGGAGEMGSDGEAHSAAGGGGGGGGGVGAAGEQLATEELLAEAAMRSALAQEKQAEAVVQAVELLRELVAALRPRAHPAAAHPAHSAHPQHPPPPPDHLQQLHHQQQHHRL